MNNQKKCINTVQSKIILFLYKQIKTTYVCPTVREICREVGLKSTASVHYHIKALVDKGYLTHDKNKKRAILFTQQGEDYCLNDDETKQFLDKNIINSEINFNHEVLTVPLVGTVQAGVPITAIENKEDDIILPSTFTNANNCFMLTVQGDSMMDVGIYDGDMILVRQQPSANNGDIVVARIDDEATVKTFYKESDHIRLQPENDAFEPIIVKDCVIEGRVVGLIRNYS